MKESGDFFFSSYSSQQNVHKNCLGNLAASRSGSIICSVHYIFCSFLSYYISEARNTCTTPPSSDAAAAIEVHRTPYNIPGKEKIVKFSVGMVPSSVVSETTRQQGGISLLIGCLV